MKRISQIILPFAFDHSQQKGEMEKIKKFDGVTLDEFAGTRTRALSMATTDSTPEPRILKIVALPNKI